MCKKKLYVEVVLLGHIMRCEAEYHPRGCMNARYSHIDIKLRRCGILENIARLFHRGIRLRFHAEKRCIYIMIPVSTEPFVICFDNAYPAVGKRCIYIKKTSSDKIYVGPITLRGRKQL